MIVVFRTFPLTFCRDPSHGDKVVDVRVIGELAGPCVEDSDHANLNSEFFLGGFG